MRRKIHVEPSRGPSSISPARWGPDTFEGTVLETRLTLVAAVLVTSLLTWSCATTMSVATRTAAEELAGIKARLTEVAFSQRRLELHLAALGEARSRFTVVQFSDLNNALRSDVAALEPILAHIESDLVAFQDKYPQHPESRGVWAGVDSTRKLIRALLAGETLPSMTVAEPPVICPGTSQWNGRGCTTKPLPYVHRTKLSPAPADPRR